MKRVLAFWSLNGKLTEKELKNQIDAFKRVGYGGFFLHARGGLETEYFSEEWFSMLRYTAEYGYSIGLEAYLYDENGWPSGYAGGRVPRKNKAFCQSFMEFIAYSEKDTLSKDCEIIAEFQSENLIAVRKYNIYYTNLLEKKAVSEFIDCTYERYKKELGDLFGNAVKGIFTDEPQLSNYGYPVYDKLFDDFENEYGYSLKDNLFKIHTADGFSKVRYDYRKLIAKKYSETFTGLIGGWCERNGLFFTGHMAAEDGLYFQSQTQIDVMPSYMNFTVPGIDVLGNKLPTLTLLKQVSSVAEQFGKKAILAETFGASGHFATPEELIDIWFYQAAYGVNTACLHLSAYSLAGRRKRDYPPDFSQNLEYFDKLNGFCESLEKVAGHSGNGERITDVLVINPIGTFFGKYANIRKILPEGECTYKDRLDWMGVTEELSEVSVNYTVLQRILAETGLDYHLGEEIIMNEHAKVSHGELSLGKYNYKTIIIPYGAVLNEKTAETCRRFALSGGKLFYAGKLPAVASGKNVFTDLREKRLLHPLPLEKERFVYATKCYGLFPAITIYDCDTRQPAEDIIVTARHTEKGKTVFIYNRNTCEKTLFLRDKGGESCFTLDKRENAVVILNKQSEVFYPVSGRTEKLCRAIKTVKTELKEFSAKTRFISDNVLPIDECECFLNGKKIFSGYFSEANEKLYSELAKSGKGTVKIIYRFQAESAPAEMYIVTEKSDDLKRVLLNGRVLNLSKRNFLSFTSVYDASGLCTDGVNEITAEYFIDASGLKPEISAFETESNVFCRKTEIESAYVFGNFILENDGIMRERRGKRYFIMSKNTIKNGDPATPLDAPFYRGEIVYEHSFIYNNEPKNGQRIFLSMQNDYPVSEYVLNGNRVITYSGKIEATNFIRKGENELKIIAHTGNGNLLGPHRYFDYDTEYVGPQTFRGVRGWEDHFNLNTPYPLVPQKTLAENRSVRAYSLGSYIKLTTVEELK